MKTKLLFVSILFFISLSFLKAQQKVVNPIKLIEEKLMREKPQFTSKTSPNNFSGMVSYGQTAPTGVFINSLSQQQLINECTFFGGDSLNGFVFEKVAKEIINLDGLKLLLEFKAAMYRKQVSFVKNKYNISDKKVNAAQPFIDVTSKTSSQNNTSASVCNNIDFEDGNTGTWTVISGYNQNSNAALTIPASAFTVGVISTNQNIYSCSDVNIITAAYGNDPIGFPGLDPNGASTSIRLGGFNINAADGYGFGCAGSHWTNGSYANGEKIEKTVLVSAANALLTYDYAVVLNDGGHGNGSQPYFHVFVTNLAGVVLSSCTQYYVQAAAGVPPAGFVNSGYVNTYDNSAFYYKNWTSNSINLTPYIGTNVKISFVAAGCTFGAHPGYAYVDAICGPLTINSSNANPCAGSNVILTAPSIQGGSYSWSGTGVTGLTTQTVSVNTSGTYSCSLIPPQGVTCAYTVTQTVSFIPLPIANAGPTQNLTCSNTTTILSGSGGGTYSWSGPGIVANGTTANPSVNVAGTYNLTVTNSFGCVSAPASVVVGTNTTPPGPNTIAPSAITCGTPNVNVAVTATAGVSYNWTGPSIISGGTTSSALVNAAGNYTVVVTNTSGNGCSASAVVNVQSSNAVTVSPSTSGVITCSNSLINLSTPNVASQSYTWTAPSGATIVSGANSAAATGSNAGTYTVTVFNTSNGCTQIGAIAVNVNTTVPSATASIAGVITCTNTAVTLNVNPAGYNYNWTASGGGVITSGATSQSATGNGNGSYYVLVTNPANGCSVTKTITPAVNTTTIAASINTPSVLTCNTTTVSLTGNPGAGVSYVWAAPNATNIVTSNNIQTIGVNAPGTYTLTLTNSANGCPSTPTTVNVTQSLTQPVLSATSQTASSGCGTSSLVTLSGTSTPAGSTYTWVSSGGFSSGVNSSSVIANGANTYTLMSSHPVTGCVASLVFTVVPSTNQPSLTISSPSGVITCLNLIQSTTVTSNPASGVTYTWTGPGIVGSATGASITGSVAGTYNLLVTNTSNNCNNSISYVITANNTPVTPSANSSNTITCVNTTTIASNVSGAGPFTYSWTGPAAFTSSAANFTTNIAGVYNVTVTNTSSGCTGTTNITAVANVTAPSTPTISANNITLTCASNATVITANSTGATSYSWSAPVGGAITSGSNTATANVVGAGVYTVVAIGGNGCNTAFFPVTATVNTPAGAPSVVLSNSVLAITCSSTSPSATANTTVSGVTYSWSPGTGIAGSTTGATVTFTQSGTYSVVVTNTTNNCSAAGGNLIVTVTNNNTPPNANATSIPTINCTNTLVTISPVYTPSTGLVFDWTGTNIVGTTTNSSVQTNSNTPITVNFTNTANGCVNSLVLAPVIDNIAPTVSLTTTTGGTNLTCQTQTLNYSALGSPTSGVTYLWSNGATTPNINITLAGSYSVIATNTVNGCQTTQNFTVGGGTSLPSFTAAANSVIPCGSSTTALNATSSNTNVSYLWGGPGGGILNGATTANPIVGSVGTYTLLVTDNTTSCSVTQTISVSNSSVIAQFTATPLTGPAPLNVNFTNQSIGSTTYMWNFGNGTSTQTNPQNSYPVSGTYTVVLTAYNGPCSDTATIIIKVLEALGVIPEVFTPNGDLYNATFEIKGLDSYPKNSLQIFNRWGNEVYKASPYKNDWVGTPNVAGKTGSDKLPTGTYYYILDLGDDAKTTFKGYVQLQY